MRYWTATKLVHVHTGIVFGVIFSTGPKKLAFLPDRPLQASVEVSTRCALGKADTGSLSVGEPRKQGPGGCGKDSLSPCNLLHLQLWSDISEEGRAVSSNRGVSFTCWPCASAAPDASRTQECCFPPLVPQEPCEAGVANPTFKWKEPRHRGLLVYVPASSRVFWSSMKNGPGRHNPQGRAIAVRPTRCCSEHCGDPPSPCQLQALLDPGPNRALLWLGLRKLFISPLFLLESLQQWSSKWETMPLGPQEDSPTGYPGVQCWRQTIPRFSASGWLLKQIDRPKNPACSPRGRQLCPPSSCLPPPHKGRADP